MKKILTGLFTLLLAQNLYGADIALTRVTTATTISSPTENSNQSAIEGAVNSLDGDNISTSANLTYNNATINGVVELGDGTSDLISANGRFDTALNPTATTTYNLGTSSLRWDIGYFQNLDSSDSVLFSSTLRVNGAVDLNSSVNIDGGLTDIGTGSYSRANGD